MLEHRSGTLFEDMYWLDPDTAEIKAKELDGDVEEKVDYSKKQWTLWMQSTGL